MVPGVLLIRLLGLYVVVGFPVKEWGLGFLIPPSSDVKSAGHLSCLASEELGHGPTPLLLGDFSSCIYPKKKMAIWQAVTHTRGLFSIQTLNSSVLWRGRAGVSSTLAGCGSPLVCVQLQGRETGLFCPWAQLFGSLSILWNCLSLGVEWKLTFSSPVAVLNFPNLLAYWV